MEIVKKKILLVYANALTEANLPLGLSFIISILKPHYDVKLFDTTFYPKKSLEMREKSEHSLEYQKLDEELPGLNNSDLFEDFNKLYSEFKPDLVGISSTSLDYKLALNLLTNVEIPVLFGGYHAVVAPEDLINHSKVTHVFRGECEDILLNLIEDILSGNDLTKFKGLWYKNNSEIIKNEGVAFVENLNNLPVPDWSLFDERHLYRPFKGKIYRVGNYALSRGCPYSCSYCINHIMQKHAGGVNKEYREMDIDKALNEIKTLIHRYDIQLLKIWDDNFLGFKKNNREFLERYAKEIGIPFMIQTRPEVINDDFAKLLKNANCVNLSLGIENGNEEIRKKILNRFAKNEAIINGFQICKQNGLRTTANVMMGFPEETRKEVFETIDLTRRCEPTTTNIFLLQTYKGTKIREWCIENGWLEKDDHREGDIRFGYILKNPNLTHKELYDLRKLFMLYINTDPKYYSIIEKAADDKLLLEFLQNLYSKVIHS